MALIWLYLLLLTKLCITALAQDHPVTAPTAGQVINAGTNFEIEWTPSNDGTISLDLGTGSSADINVVMNIATGIPNTGSFQWSVADSIPAGTDYTIKISSGSTDVNFSARFTIVSSVNSVSSSSSSSSTSTSTTSTSPSTTSSPLSTTATSTSSSSSTSPSTVSQTSQGVTSTTTTSPTTTTSGRGSSSGAVASNTQGASATVTVVVNNDAHVGAIVGGVVGGIVVIVLILMGMYYVYRRGGRSGLKEADIADGSGEMKLKDQTMASGNLDQNGNLEVRNSTEGGYLKGEANPEIGPPSHGLRYLDAERLGTTSG